MTRLATASALLVLVSIATGMFATPTHAPVERLVRNAGAYVTEHPSDGYGHYVLARVHALAFTLESETIAVWNDAEDRQGRRLPQVASEESQGWNRFGRNRSGDGEVKPDREELVGHLREAVGGFERAIALQPPQEKVEQSDWGMTREPGRALYHLGLAYVLERGAIMGSEVEVLPSAITVQHDAEVEAEPEAESHTEPAEELAALVEQLGSGRQSRRNRAVAALRLRLDEAAPLLFERRQSPDEHVRAAVHELLIAYWTEQAIRHYFIAFDRAIVGDIAIEHRPLRGLSTLISYEAGTAYLILVRARGVRDGAEQARIEKVTEALATLDAKPHSGIITPILLSLNEPRPLRDLVDPDARVCFDLDGDGYAELWPWIKPGTALLVWDPTHEGNITSGRQLFGSVSWWVFPRDGYHALDLLDDDRDGQLAGPELDGLALWFDLGSDGVSDPGEVITVADAGVLAIDTHALSEEDGCPANRTGLELVDGRVLPTYDWITSPADPALDSARDRPGTLAGR